MVETLSVVPIFVNAGTALIPAIVAPLASVLALLLRPKQMIAAIRRRPVVAGAVLVGLAGAGWGVGHALSSPAAATRPRAAYKVDWIKEAMEEIRREQLGGMATSRPATASSGAIVFRGDYARCGFDGGKSPLSLRPAWEYKPEGAMMLASPAVANGRVYSASCVLDPIGGNFGTVFCLEAATGRLIWELKEIDGAPIKPFFSSPALTADGKRLVIGQGLHEDENSDLICLDAQSGAVQWRLKTTLHIEGSPAILGDMVVAGAGAIEGPDHRPKPKTDPGFVVAVRISDGKELWRFAVNDPESSPAIGADGTVYIGSGFQGNAVVALRSESDEALKAQKLDRVVWQVPTPHPATGAVALTDELVLIGCGNGDYIYADPKPAGMVLAIDRKTGDVRWKAAMPDGLLGSLAAREGKVICPVRNGEVVSLRLSDGGEAWRQKMSGGAPILAAPAYTGKHVYVVSKDGYLAVLSGGDGKVLERHYLNDPQNPGAQGLTVSSPMIAGGSVFVGSETGGLRAFLGGRSE